MFNLSDISNLLTSEPVKQKHDSTIASLTRDAFCDISVRVTTLFRRLSYSK